MIAGLCLVVIGVLLLVAGPRLASATWPVQAPRLAILAWQCSDVCLNLPWPLSAMFLGTSASWRVVWGSSLPLTMLGLLALLSWRKSVQYDLIRPIAMNTPTTDP